MAISRQQLLFRNGVDTSVADTLLSRLESLVEGDEGFVYVSSVTRTGEKALVGVSVVADKEDTLAVDPAAPQLIVKIPFVKTGR